MDTTAGAVDEHIIRPGIAAGEAIDAGVQENVVRPTVATGQAVDAGFKDTVAALDQGQKGARRGLAKWIAPAE